jgi:alkanesulfonate monooxygenase SsuD/methylene tetrahydromethanopterin reductase-like flavin-dependent oxidoreductase (luciferase family)
VFDRPVTIFFEVSTRYPGAPSASVSSTTSETRPQDPPTLSRKILDQIVRGEELGWDDVWVSEHHFVDDDYLPSVLTMLAAIAARTTRVRIGTGILLLPLHDPIRVAEDAAVVDVLSAGRPELGFGAGYRVEELAAWGVAAEERGSRMNEAIPLIRRLFAGETVTHEGKCP